MSIIKSFIFDEETVSHLEKLAKRDGITHVQVIKNLIEKKYKKISTQKREL